MKRDLKTPLSTSEFEGKPMCLKGMKAYDRYVRADKSPQSSNKLASKSCSK